MGELWYFVIGIYTISKFLYIKELWLNSDIYGRKKKEIAKKKKSHFVFRTKLEISSSNSLTQNFTNLAQIIISSSTYWRQLIYLRTVIVLLSANIFYLFNFQDSVISYRHRNLNLIYRLLEVGLHLSNIPDFIIFTLSIYEILMKFF